MSNSRSVQKKSKKAKKAASYRRERYDSWVVHVGQATFDAWSALEVFTNLQSNSALLWFQDAIQRAEWLCEIASNYKTKHNVSSSQDRDEELESCKRCLPDYRDIVEELIDCEYHPEWSFPKERARSAAKKLSIGKFWDWRMSNDQARVQERKGRPGRERGIWETYKDVTGQVTARRIRVGHGEVLDSQISPKAFLTQWPH